MTSSRLNFLDDLRFSFRTWRRSPLVAGAIILTLGVAVGFCTSGFSVVDTVVFKGLPFRDASQLFFLWENNKQSNKLAASGPVFRRWQNLSTPGVEVAALQPYSADLIGGSQPVQLIGSRVSPIFLRVLGVGMQLGHDFDLTQRSAAAPQPIMLSSKLWRTHFHSDQDVVGRTVYLDGSPRIVIGVLPRNFAMTSYQNLDFLVPLDPDAPELGDSKAHVLTIVARLARNDRIRDVLSEAANQMEVGREPYGVTLVPFDEYFLGTVRTPILLVFAAAVGVLLIACLNVLTLLSTQISARAGEFAVRMALGASSKNILRLILADAAVIGPAAGVFGIVIAHAVIALFSIAPHPDIPRIQDVSVGLTSVGFCLLVSVCCMEFAAVWQYASMSRRGLSLVLGRCNGRLASVGRRSGRQRLAMIGIQVLFAVMILDGTAYLYSAIRDVTHVVWGFNDREVVVTQISLPHSRYPTATSRVQFFERLVSALRSRQLASGASVSSNPPMVGSDMSVSLEQIEDTSHSMRARYSVVGEAYFDLMRIPLLYGRTFTLEEARNNRAGVCLLSQSLAQRLLPNVRESVTQPLRLTFGREILEAQVIGVVGDVRQRVGGESEPRIYLPYGMDPSNSMYVIVKMHAGASQAEGLITEEVTRLDQNQPTGEISSISERVRRALGRPIFYMLLFGMFGIQGFVLAVAGVYATLSAHVQSRTREIGIRVALGATTWRIVREVVSPAGVVVVLATLAGSGMSLKWMPLFAHAVAIGTKFYSFAYLGPAVMLLLVSFCALVLPTRRAMSVNAADVIREM